MLVARTLLLFSTVSVLVWGLAGCWDPPPSVAEDERGLSDVQLVGKRAFFDTKLSTPAGQSCASCHEPAKGFSGNNGSTVGVAKGAVDGALGTRNVPSAMYQAFAPGFAFVNDEGELIPQGGQFLDGRAMNLSEQAQKPFFNPLEMNNTGVEELIAKVAHSNYASLFKKLYGEDIFDHPQAALAHLGDAIAAFETSERFAPFSSRYDDYVQGKASLSAQEMRGLQLFMDAEKGNCAGCHVADPATGNPEDSLFTDFTYDNLGVPRNNAIPANADAAHFDLGLCGPGRSDLSAMGGLCGAFKVPSLRNVAKKDAFMHNGFFNNLRDVVAFYVTRETDPSRWYPDGNQYDDLPEEYKGNVNQGEVPYDRKLGETPRLNDTEIDDVVAFLQTLNDRE